MQPYQHPCCNDTLGPPKGMTEEQVRTLHIFREPESPAVSSFWQPEPGELEALNLGGSIRLRFEAHTHPPLSVTACLPPSEHGGHFGPTTVITAEMWESLQAERDRHITALKRIMKWHGEFPATGKTWESGAPMSYFTCNGSDGERDYMRAVAAHALDPFSTPPTPPAA